MSELQLGLLIVGALAVVGVVAYNRTQERRARRSAERAFASRHADVLLESDASRREPSLSLSVSPREEMPAARAEEDLPNERLDYVIALDAQNPISSALMLEGWKAIERRFGRRALLASRAANDDWQRAAAGASGARSHWRCALQLVSRNGVVNEAELIEFRSAVETLAVHIGASVAAPEMREALDQARALDQACAEADIQVALHIVKTDGTGFALDAVRQAFKTHGLDEQAPGHWAQIDVQGRELFGVTAETGERDDISRLTLTLDVPRTPDLRRSYESMVVLARDLAATLNGRLQDDNARGLDEHALSAIAAQLEPVRVELEQRGFAPGGALALRLFS